MRKIGVGLMVGMAFAACAASAQAASTISVKVAGAAFITTGSYTCNQTANEDDRVTASCPDLQVDGKVTLRALPARPGGRAEWVFKDWKGCVIANDTQCTVDGNSSRTVTATLVD